MKHIMFDVDGTLVESCDFDEECYIEAVRDATGLDIASNWEAYPHVTDRGILKTFIERQAKNYSIDELESLVKPIFISKINSYLKSNSVREVTGAIKFIEYLKSKSDIALSIATGGWRETAIAKLESAGFDLTNIPLASSNDHYSRTEIMKLAQNKANHQPHLSLTYFGDAEWDLKACKDLDINFVIIGSRTNHNQTINDYTDIEKIMSYL